MIIRIYMRNIRLNSGMSQQDVAKKIKITRQSYNQIENGNRQKEISLSMLQKLADAFVVPIDTLIQAENEYKAGME